MYIIPDYQILPLGSGVPYDRDVGKRLEDIILPCLARNDIADILLASVADPMCKHPCVTGF